MFTIKYIKGNNDSANLRSVVKADDYVLTILELFEIFFKFLFRTPEIFGSVSEKQTSFSCPVKIGP